MRSLRYTEDYDANLIGTGVAYANVATGSDRVWHIQRWPGRAQAEVSKVGFPNLTLQKQTKTIY